MWPSGMCAVTHRLLSPTQCARARAHLHTHTQTHCIGGLRQRCGGGPRETLPGATDSPTTLTLVMPMAHGINGRIDPHGQSETIEERRKDKGVCVCVEL